MAPLALVVIAREVHPLRILLALGIAAVAAYAGKFLPFAADVQPQAALRLLFVTAFTTMCWLLSAMPIAAASMLPLLLLPIFSVQSTAEVTRGYSDPILWLFGGGFVLAQAIEVWGLHRRVALRVITIVGPYPRRLVLGFFLAATCISMFINNTSVALMLLPIGTMLVERTLSLGELNGKHAKNFGAAIMCAIAFGASSGGMGTPIGTAPNALFFGCYDKLVEQGAAPVSFLGWTLAFAPYAIVLSVAASYAITHLALPIPRMRLFRGDELLAEARALPALTTPEKRVAWVFAIAVLLWMTRSDITLGAGQVIHGWAHYLVPPGERDRYIADGTVAVAVAIALLLLPAGTKHGERLMTWEIARKMPFDLLFLLGAGIALADAFLPTGLSRAFGEAMRPLIGNVHPALLLLVLVLGITALSEVASNTAIASLFLPILRDGAIAAQMDPLMLMLPATIAASCGFMLPIATPPNTIVFSSRLITFGQMARAGLALDLIAALLLLPCLWFWSLPILGVDPAVIPKWLSTGVGK
ncbi:MAG: SLC13 family permease [Planctomycetota bacterium]